MNECENGPKLGDRITAVITEKPAFKLVRKLAAAMAREIRNPIGSARGFLELAGMKEEGECFFFRHYVPMAIRELERVDNMIGELLSLAADKPVNKELHHLDSIMEDLLPLISEEAAAAGIRVETDLRDVPGLLVDYHELRQLILSIVRNGLEAMSVAGRLTLKTFLENDTAVLAVEDTGKGVRNDVLQRLGTPFFTTKKFGTGLGLAVCFSIARRHDAEITIETCPRGTTVYVRFKPTQKL
ncbi:MAG: ATP-binding protein [Bacillota bacterium]